MFFDDRGEPIITPDRKGRVHHPGTRPIEELLMCEDALFVDFIKKCLVWYPTRRLTPEQGLVHEWILAGLPASIKLHHIQSVKSLAAAAALKDVNNANIDQSNVNDRTTDKSAGHRQFKIKSGSQNQVGNNNYYRAPTHNPNDQINQSKIRHASNERSVDKHRKDNTKFMEATPQKYSGTIKAGSPAM